MQGFSVQCLAFYFTPLVLQCKSVQKCRARPLSNIPNTFMASNWILASLAHDSVEFTGNMRIHSISLLDLNKEHRLPLQVPLN